MKKSLLFLAFICPPFIFSAQELDIKNDTCPPVPLVIAELLENDDIFVTWDVPCDTCNNVLYRVAVVTGFDPCKGEPPEDGTIIIIGTTSDIQFINASLPDPLVLVFAVQALYTNCDSEWTFSNIIYFDIDFNIDHQLTVNVSLEDEANPEGVSLIVDGANCYYEDLVYTELTNSEGIGHFEEIEYGIYDIIVNKDGYHTAVVEDFYLNKDDTVNIELKIYYVDILESDEMEKLRIFPNPATSQLTFRSEEIIEKITMINHLGQVVFSREANEKQLVINTSKLRSGIYIVRVGIEKGLMNKRVVISDW